MERIECSIGYACDTLMQVGKIQEHNLYAIIHFYIVTTFDALKYKAVVRYGDTINHRFGSSRRVARLNFRGEASVFASRYSEPLQGLTNGSMFSIKHGMDVAWIPSCDRPAATFGPSL